MLKMVLSMQVSDKHFTTLTPAGYAFNIWALIWFTQATAAIWLLVRPDDQTAVCPFTLRLSPFIHS
jgi:hypothetical protein